jgi:hypothetical protein
MRHLEICASLVIACTCFAAPSVDKDFEFDSKGVCDRQDSKRPDRLTLGRFRDGSIRARILVTSYCLGPGYTPHVEYLTDRVNLKVTTECEQIAIDVSCKMELTFHLLRKVAQGTPVIFSRSSNDQELRAIAP